MFHDSFFQNSVAKYLEKKGESLEKLNCNLVSETARTTVRIQVSSITGATHSADFGVS